jgi:hypothetical protein
MKFRFGTKEGKSVKLVSEPVDEKTALAPGTQEETRPSRLDKPSQHTKRLPLWLSALGILTSCIVLVCGQVFMVAAVCTGIGTLCSGLFGFSFDRIMFHCGPQDTYFGVFVLLSVPVFWYAWYLSGRRFLKYALMALTCPAAFFLGSNLVPAGWPVFVLGLAGVLMLGLLHKAALFCRARKNDWPRQFSVTRWLTVSYVPAGLLLLYEFSILDLTATVNSVSSESLLTAAAIVAAFSFLPALLTAIDARSRQFASGFGLSVIGQLPVLAIVLFYCLANGLMFALCSTLGIPAVAEYFHASLPVGLEPDLDNITTVAELMAKFLTGCAIWFVLLLSIWSGSTIGTQFNRWRRRHDDPV